MLDLREIGTDFALFQTLSEGRFEMDARPANKEAMWNGRNALRSTRCHMKV
jgi:hypothetical protein